MTEEEVFAPVEAGKKQRKVLAVVVTSDRGLCGGVNSAVSRQARQNYINLKKAGHDVTVRVVAARCSVQARPVLLLVCTIRRQLAASWSCGRHSNGGPTRAVGRR